MDDTVEYTDMVTYQIEALSEYDAKLLIAIMAGQCPNTFRYALDFLD
jgi:hypothetical protein